MGLIIIPKSEITKISDNKASTLIYPTGIICDIAARDKFLAQADFLKCTDVDYLLRRAPSGINWLTDNTSKFYR
jgi:hypothetical protein